MKIAVMRRLKDRGGLAMMRHQGSVAVGLGLAAFVSTLVLSSPVSAQSAPVYIGQTGHGLDYFKCADEGGTCTLGDTRYTAYGVPGHFTFQLRQGSFSCSNATFGVDPAPGATKACYFSLYTNALTGSLVPVTEGTTRNFGTGNIAYGANGSFNFIQLPALGGFYDCTNATFGDPAPGLVKACYQPGTYASIAQEGATLPSLTQTPVVYGANGKFIYTILSGTRTCSNATFGDPSPGILKTCYVLLFSHVADEGQSFNLGSGDFFTVLYGSARNGNFFFGGMQAGNCNNATFGDPDVGVTKHCYGKAGVLK